ncbi:MAG: RidA family protein [Gammaproteobacteria bacterium]|nr:RidA family protein [Gammaproteobacteria bacterium]MBV9621425.1 RidA family protein [Gammaproteobacteria bacterium]
MRRRGPSALFCLLTLGGLPTPVPAAGAAPSVQYFPAPIANAPFSAAVRVGDMLYLSGQIGIGADGTLPRDFADQVRQAMGNVGEVLKQAGASFDDVVKCTVMLADMARWEDFNQIYLGYFKHGHLPARSALGTSGLARGAQLEIECWAYRPVAARAR